MQEEDKSPTPWGIQTHDLQISQLVFQPAPTTVLQLLPQENYLNSWEIKTKKFWLRLHSYLELIQRTSMFLL